MSRTTVTKHRGQRYEYSFGYHKLGVEQWRRSRKDAQHSGRNGIDPSRDLGSQSSRDTSASHRPRVQVTGAVKIASDANERQHEITMTEIELIRAATEQQVKELREEIRQLKLEIERSVQQIVASVGKVSASEQQRLQETSNAKFNVWVAKEIVLKNLLDIQILRIFKSQIGDWVAAFESATWKMQPYLTIKPFRSTTETQPCPDIEPETKMRSPDIVGPLSEDRDRGSNIAYAEALQIIRRNSCVFDLYKFNLESDLFFDNVFRSCSPGFRYQCAQILLKAGAKPTYKSLIEALQCREGDTVSLLGDAIFTSQKGTTTENLTRNSHHLAGGRKSQSDSERFSQLLRCCDSHELSELVYLLNKCPELINEQIEGALPLTVAAQSANADVVAILSLYGSPIVCTEDIHKSPLLVAIDRLNLQMACTMIDYHSSPLEPGWEWPALTSLADKNFKAPAQSIDYIIEQIGILHGLRLAIEHRHERLIRFMLWRFKLKSPDTGSAEVLEMAVQSGICREYAEHVKGYVEENTGLVEVADSPVPVFRTCSRRRSDGQIGMRVLNLARR